MAVPRVVCGATEVGCLAICAVVVVVFAKPKLDVVAAVALVNENEGVVVAVAAAAAAPSVKPVDVVAAVPKLNPVAAGATEVVGATVNPVDDVGVVLEGVVVQLRAPPKRKPLVFVVVVVVPVMLNPAEIIAK